MRIFGWPWRAAGVVVAATLACAGCASSAPAPRPSASAARAASTTSSRYPEAVPRQQRLAPRVLASRWRPGRPWSHRLLLAGTFTDVVAAGDLLYLLETLPGRAESMQLLVRVDLRTGAVRYAHQLVPVAGTGTVVNRSGVWLLGPAWLSRNVEQSGRLTLYRFDPQTLQLISKRTVGPAGCCGHATLTGWTGGRLWLSVGSTVRLIHPTPWTVLQTVRIAAGQVESLSASPDRRRLYLALEGAGAATGRQLQERALPGWRIVHTGGISRLLDIGPISAAGAALWVVAGGGMTGEIQLFTADLRHVRLALGAGELARGREEKQFFSVANYARAAVVGGATWLTTGNALACLQPDTGQVLAEQPGSPSITMTPVAVAGDIYGFGAGGLVQLQPPSACEPS
jgi:hypothetical protein